MSGIQHLDGWEEHLRRNRTDGTTKTYKSWAIRFEDWREWADFSVSPDVLLTFETFLRDTEELTEFEEEYVDATSYWNRCQIPDDGYSYRSRVQAISAIKSYVDYCYGVEFADREMHQVNHIVRGEEPDFDPTIASSEQIQEIFETTKECHSDSCYPMTILGYDAIMRGIELTRVRWKHIDVDRGTIYVQSAKGSPRQHIAVSDKTMDALIDYHEIVQRQFNNPQFFFYRLNDGYKSNNPWTPNDWSKHFREHWDDGWHSIGRHSAITNRLNNGASLSEVHSRARHARLANTRKYINFVSNGGSTPPELQ